MVLIVLVALGLLLYGQTLVKKAGRSGAADVADILDGTVPRGAVTVKGVVEEIDPGDGSIYLRDLERLEVCRDSTCMRAVIRVVTAARYEIGEKAEISGRIAYKDDLPYIVVQ